MNIAWISETGKRENNQDACTIFSQEDKPGVAIIADGMGGHAGGATASRLAVEHIYRSCADETAFDIAWLRRVVGEANALVHRTAQQDMSLRGMGTTLVVCVMRPDGILVANVGDSRLYRFDGTSLEQITVDHSYVQELVLCRILSREEARVHPRRNIILRAVGTDTTVEPDVFSEAWKTGDLVVLSTDGLHDYLTDAQFSEILSRKEPLQQKLELLVETALSQGSTDNITVVACANDGEAAL